jgi:acyl carrier protein
MTLEEIIKKQPELIKITSNYLYKIFDIKVGGAIDFNERWGDQGCDDLDCIEFLMEIEKEFDIVIPDEIAILLFDTNVYPPNFQQIIREQKLDQLGL